MSRGEETKEPGPRFTEKEIWLRDRYRAAMCDMINNPGDEEKKRTFEHLAKAWGQVVTKTCIARIKAKHGGEVK